MSKKKETSEKHEKEEVEHVHLKVLADLYTVSTVYYQGEEIGVNPEEAKRLLSEHAGYFEIVTD